MDIRIGIWDNMFPQYVTSYNVIDLALGITTWNAWENFKEESTPVFLVGISTAFQISRIKFL